MQPYTRHLAVVECLQGLVDCPIALNPRHAALKFLSMISKLWHLDPERGRPELLQFNYDPSADAKENRGELVVAALVSLRLTGR